MSSEEMNGLIFVLKMFAFVLIGYFSGVPIAYIFIKARMKIKLFEFHNDNPTPNSNPRKSTYEYSCELDKIRREAEEGYFDWPFRLIIKLLKLISSAFKKVGTLLNLVSERIAAIYISHKFKREANIIRKLMRSQ